ncbi:tRNA (guanine(26)-N(2))-dimethyltransferase-like isoform X2 [Bolinopsis microptera]
MDFFWKILEFLRKIHPPEEDSPNTSICSRGTMTESESGPVKISEGKAEILFTTQNEVFYNKVQELNRDFTVTALTTFGKHVHANDRKILKRARQLNDNDNNTKAPGLKVLEALGATGLRSVRFSKELGSLAGRITCNDVSPEAVIAMKRNIAHNECQNITASTADACVLMCTNKNEFDVVDLDPYGTPAMFLDTAVQAVRSGGLLCVTATDLAVLAGNHIQACYGKYGGMPLKRVYCHEFALRLLLSCVDSHANRHGRYIKPLFSYKADFYVRVFVQVFQSLGEVQKTSSRRSYVYDCVGCHAFHLQKVGVHTPGTQQVAPGRGPPVSPNCEECGRNFYIGGPIWSDPIHDTEFLGQMKEHLAGEGKYLGTIKRMTGMLTLAEEELPDIPLFYELSTLSKTIHCTCPPLAIFRSAILNAGYRVSLSHVCPKSIKTNAPPSVVWDVMRRWALDNGAKLREPDTVAGILLRKQPTLAVDFTLHPLAKQDPDVLRFPPNPEPHWGPKARAGKRKPDSPGGDSGAKARKTPKKEPLHDLKLFSCKRFEMNQCDLGDSCRYSHNTKENNLENANTEAELNNSMVSSEILGESVTSDTAS